MKAVVLLELMQKEFEQKEFIDRVWLYRGEVVVVDFVINTNRIAFNHFVDSDGIIECQVFSRNEPDSLVGYTGQYKVSKSGRILLSRNSHFEATVNKINIFIKKYLTISIFDTFKEGRSQKLSATPD